MILYLLSIIIRSYLKGFRSFYSISANVLLGINMFSGNIFQSDGMMPKEDDKELLGLMKLGTVTVVIS